MPNSTYGAYVESGEGIESCLRSAVSRAKCNASWNPVKELKVSNPVIPLRTCSALVESGEGIERFAIVSTTIPSIISVESGEGIERREGLCYVRQNFQWNPVKELKVAEGDASSWGKTSGATRGIR